MAEGKSIRLDEHQRSRSQPPKSKKKVSLPSCSRSGLQRLRMFAFFFYLFFLEKLTCSSKSCTSVGFLRGRVWFPLWSNVITLARNSVNDRDRDVSTEEKARIFSSLIGLPASTENFVVLTVYVGSLTNNRYVDDSILKLVLPDRYSKQRQPDESLQQKTVRFQGKFTCSKKGCS